MNGKLKKFKKHELSDSMKRKIIGSGANCDTIENFNAAFDLCFGHGFREQELTNCIDAGCLLFDSIGG